MIRASVRLAAAALRERPEIIHANNVHAAAISLPAALIGPSKLVWHARDPSPGALLSGLLGRRSSRVIAVSSWVRRQLCSHGVAPWKISVIHNGVEPGAAVGKESAGNEPPARAVERNGSFVFGHVGQFVPRKGQMLFLSAAARVTGAVPDARFLLVGEDIFGRDSDYAERVRRLARGGPVSDRVTLAGWCSDMEPVYAKLDCLVHTAEEEPFGRVLIEAMRAGVPVIAVDSGGPAEVIRDGLTGLLVPPGDAGAVSAALSRMANEPGLAESISERARREVAERFAAAEVARKVERIYASLLRPGCGCEEI